MLASNPIQIAELLQTTFIGSTQLIREAEAQLKQLHEDPQFLQNLLQICKQTSHPYNIRKSAMLYTLTYCKNIESKFTQQLVMNVAKFLFFQLAENTLQYNLRRHLISSIQYVVVNFDKHSRVKAVLYKQCVEKCALAAKTEDQALIVYVGLAIQTVLTISLHSTRQLSQFIRSSILNFCEVTLNLYRAIEQLMLNEQLSQLLSQILQILKIYSSGFKLFMKKMPYLDLQTVKCVYQQSVCQIFKRQWQLKIPQNLIPTNIIYHTRFRNRSLQQQLHSIKADYMQCLGILIKIVFQYFKNIEVISKHPIIGNPELVNILIIGTSSLLHICPHYNITSYSLIKLLEQILNCLIIAVRTKHFTKIFSQKKKQLLQQTIFPILQLSKSDIYKLESDPQELINEIIQIIDMDPKEFQNNRKKQNQILEDYQDIQDYKSLRTVASTLLFEYCKYVDQVVVEILGFAEKVFDTGFGKFNKGLVLIVLCVLRVPICNRSLQGMNLLKYLITKLQQTPLPPLIACSSTSNELQKQQNLEYALTLLCIHKYLQKVSNVEPIYTKQLGHKLRTIMEIKQIESVIKIIVYDMVRTLLQKYQQIDASQIVTFVDLGNRLLIGANVNSDKILEMIFNLYKIFDGEIASNPQTIMDTLTNLFNVIDRQVKHRDVADMNIIIKCWNIITDICQNQKIVQLQFQNIQLLLLSLSEIFLSYPALDYSDYLLLALNSLIKFQKKVNEPILKTFTQLFSVFKTVFKLQFTLQSFETINLVIGNLINVQQNSLHNEMKKNILEICILGINTKVYQNQNRDWSVCLPPVLVLQNFIILCHQSFNIDVWHLVAKEIVIRVDQLQHNLFKSNIVATIGLALMYGHAYFNQNQQTILISKLLQHSPSLNDKHSLKITIISLCSIILNQFFTAETFTLLSRLSQTLYELEKNDNDSEGTKQYEQYLEQIKNNIMETNQNNYIKSMINQLKINDLQKFQAVVQTMEPEKVAFLKRFMNTAKINNDTRQIFRIKR